jgi:transketolase
MWEAFEQGSYSGLDRLVAIIDVNRLGQRGPTRHGWDTSAYARRLNAFGWHTLEIDGHDTEEIDQAYTQAIEHAGQPTAILARTVKGKGVAAVEDAEGMHGKPLSDPEQAIRELGGPRQLTVTVARSEATPVVVHRFEATPVKLPTYQVGETVATRTASGEALAALGSGRGDVVVLDGEVSDSTRTEYFADAHPERFFEFFIAEQQMVAAAVGMQARRWVPFAATFAAFFTRAYDFIRMAAASRANLRLIGSHAGVSIGQDGPSQMGLEDLACLRAVHGSTVLYPCDGNQSAHLIELMADRPGISYLRTTRGNTPVIYSPDETFRIGGSHVLRSSTDDQVTVVAAGVTVHEALKAAEELADAGVATRVIDLYSVKPVDAATLRQAALDTGKLVTVEDHWPEGGLGDAVLDVFADARQGPRIVKLAVRAMPASGTPAEQLHAAGIDAQTIENTVRALATS